MFCKRFHHTYLIKSKNKTCWLRFNKTFWCIPVGRSENLAGNFCLLVLISISGKSTKKRKEQHSFTKISYTFIRICRLHYSNRSKETAVLCTTMVRHSWGLVVLGIYSLRSVKKSVGLKYFVVISQ